MPGIVFQYVFAFQLGWFPVQGWSESFWKNLATYAPLPIMLAESRAMLRDRVSSLRRANVYEAQRYRHTVSACLIDRIDSESS